MIRGFEPPQALEPEQHERVQWPAAIGAGLIAGIILLIAPQGSPWSALTFFAREIMGRPIPGPDDGSFFVTSLVHLLVSMVYGLIISVMVVRVTKLRAVVVGGLVGLFLYVMNFGIVSLWFPDLRTREGVVLFTHIVFGLIAGGAYRGLLRRAPARLPEASR